jgi:hypothetical protein
MSLTCPRSYRDLNGSIDLVGHIRAFLSQNAFWWTQSPSSEFGTSRYAFNFTISYSFWSLCPPPRSGGGVWTRTRWQPFDPRLRPSVAQFWFCISSSVFRRRLALRVLGAICRRSILREHIHKSISGVRNSLPHWKLPGCWESECLHDP